MKSSNTQQFIICPICGKKMPKHYIKAIKNRYKFYSGKRVLRQHYIKEHPEVYERNYGLSTYFRNKEIKAFNDRHA